MFDAVVLAAGYGRRMGGAGKAMIEVHGQPLLERTLSTCAASGCRTSVVVVREGDNEVHSLAENLKGELVLNPDPDRGMFSSVFLGLSDLLKRVNPPAGVFVFPVDHALVEAKTLRLLMENFGPGWEWIQPTHGGTSGHPILLSSALCRSVVGKGEGLALVESLSSATLRDVLQPFLSLRKKVEVPDPGVIRNLNRPGDLP